MRNNIREQFKILTRKIHGKPLVYFDNAATTQIAEPVLNKMIEFETNHRANVHRGVHTLSEEASDLYDNARENIKKAINANIVNEIVLTKGSTEALNLAADSYVKNIIQEGDIIVVSEAEHHSNLLPWQRLAKNKNAKLEFFKVDEQGFIDIKNSEITWNKVKFIAITHISNLFGSINDIEEIRKEIKRKIITAKNLNEQERKDKNNFPKMLVDVSQSIAHIPINVQKMGVDMLAFSGHKMYGPMGTGILYINRDLFRDITPAEIGGGMIKEVTNYDYITQQMPEMLEAGTPNVTGMIGLSAAFDFINSIGFEKIEEHEQSLTKQALHILNENTNITIHGMDYKNLELNRRAAVISISHKNIPSHDLAAIFDTEGIAVRSGHHCVMPWHKNNNISATTRISFAIYNTTEEVQKLEQAIKKAENIFSI